MIERAIEIKAGYQATLQSKDDLKDHVLLEEEWESLGALLKFLKPIKEATLMVSKEKTPNVASATMIFQHLFTHFDNMLKIESSNAPFLPVIAKAAKAKLEKYYPETGGKVYVFGTSKLALTIIYCHWWTPLKTNLM